MRKIQLVSVLIFTLLLTNVFAQRKLNDRQRMGISGAAISFSEFSYAANDSAGKIFTGNVKQENGLSRNRIAEFDKNGNLTLLVTYNDNGTIFQRTVNTYDQNGKRTESRITDANGDPVLRFTILREGNTITETGYDYRDQYDGKSVMRFDEKGNETERTDYNAGDTITHRVVTIYDSLGRKSSMKIYGPENKPEHLFIYKYNEQGLVSHEILMDEAHGMIFDMIYRYDSKNRLTEQIQVLPDKSIFAKTVFTYDLRGNKKSETDFNGAGGQLNKKIWTYYRNGIVKTHNEYRSDNTPYGRFDGKYDSHGNLISAGYYESGSSGVLTQFRKYEYVYDASGNWIRKTVFVNGNADIVVKRVIAY